MHSKWYIIAGITLLLLAVSISLSEARYFDGPAWFITNSTDSVWEINLLNSSVTMQGNHTLTNSRWYNGLLSWPNLREVPDYLAKNYTNNTFYFNGHLIDYFYDLFVNRTGDNMTGNLYIDAQLNVTGNVSLGLSNQAGHIKEPLLFIDDTSNKITIGRDTVGSSNSMLDIWNPDFLTYPITLHNDVLGMKFTDYAGTTDYLLLEAGSWEYAGVIAANVDQPYSADVTGNCAFEANGSVKVGANYIGALIAAPNNGIIVEGDVGINTTDPNATLEVHGYINATYNISAANLTASDYVCIAGDCRGAWPSSAGAGEVYSDDLYVNETGDTMTGDLNITGDLRLVTMSGVHQNYINLTNGSIAWTGVISGNVGWGNLTNVPHYLANNYTNSSDWAKYLEGNFTSKSNVSLYAEYLLVNYTNKTEWSNSSTYANHSTWTANLLGNYTNSTDWAKYLEGNYTAKANVSSYAEYLLVNYTNKSEWSNSSTYLDGHPSSYYLGGAGGISTDMVQAFVNRTGDNMTGNLQIFSGAGYVNISASGGDVLASDDIQALGDLISGRYVNATGGATFGDGVFVTSGNVGIGTTSPSSLLTLQSSAADTSGGLRLIDTADADILAFMWDSGNAGNLLLRQGASSKIHLKADGDSYITNNLGLGTSSPQTLLHLDAGSAGADPGWSSVDHMIIEDNSNAFIQFFVPTGNQGGIAVADTGGRSRGWFLYTNNGDYAHIGASGDEVARFSTSEVAINDDSDDQDFRVESNGQTHMIFVDGGNNRVGISESSPTSTLHVDGSFAVEGHRSISANTTLVETDFSIECDTTAAEIWISLPATANCNGRIYNIYSKSSNNDCYIDPNGAETIGGGTKVRLALGGASVMIYSTGSTWILMGSWLDASVEVI